MLRACFYLIFLTASLSCSSSNYFSSQVRVKMCGGARARLVQEAGGSQGVKSTCLPPVVFYLPESEEKKVVCRRGLPNNFATPWDFQLQQAGKSDLAAEGAEPEEEARSDIIIQDITGDYWFKVFPLIENKTNYYLVVTSLEFKVKSGSGEPENKTFDSSYCETEPYLYILDNSGSSTGSRGQGEFAQGSYTTYDQFDRAFVQGNLAFYVDGLSAAESPSTQQNTNFFSSRRRVPNYFVGWEMIGTFYTESGQQVGSFEKRGYFSTRRSSF